MIALALAFAAACAAATAVLGLRMVLEFKREERPTVVPVRAEDFAALQADVETLKASVNGLAIAAGMKEEH